ncbi:hypothetical protein KIW84_074667 [Lathyrus oleraceus]|uniref:Uncharacterized protein n=1 Tax=Pisum sativum TaxID=3888 RepID=A0A9D4VRV5_PEA|nr:hypothetical protein KIW84_074667 [Pisum sativum]
MMGKTPRISESGCSTPATRNLDERKRSDKVPWCDHYKREWYTCETCWKLKGKPLNWKKKGGRAFQASNSNQGRQFPPTQLPLTTEQLDRLYKLLESLTPSCFIATKGNQKIKIADGSFSAIAGKCSVVLSPMLTLKNVIHDLNSGKTIGSVKENEGLYYLDIGYASSDVNMAGNVRRMLPYPSTHP